jgi:hypothetical protein
MGTCRLDDPDVLAAIEVKLRLLLLESPQQGLNSLGSSIHIAGTDGLGYFLHVAGLVVEEVPLIDGAELILAVEASFEDRIEVTHSALGDDHGDTDLHEVGLVEAVVEFLRPLEQ